MALSRGFSIDLGRGGCEGRNISVSFYAVHCPFWTTYTMDNYYKKNENKIPKIVVNSVEHI